MPSSSARSARRSRDRRAAGRDRHRRRQRRRDQQDRLRNLHQGPADRLRRRKFHTETESRPGGLSRLPPADGPVHRPAGVPPAVLHRRRADERPRRGQDGHCQLQSGDRGCEAGRRVHAGCLAGRGLDVPAQPPLSDARRLYRRGGGRDAGGIRGHRRRRHRRAARQPRPGDGAPHRLSGPDRSGIPQAGRAANRGAEPRAGERSGQFGAAASVLGQLRRPARLRHPVAEDPADHPEGQTAGDLVRGRQPAARA